MIQYLDLFRLVLDDGKFRPDRTGTGTYSVFGAQARFPLGDGFPLVTTKKLHLKSIIYELLWFLRGDTNTKYLNEHGVSIWDEWADERGDLGRIYGAQWCDWRGPDGRSINQIQQVIHQIRESPNSRRLPSRHAACRALFALLAAADPTDRPLLLPHRSPPKGPSGWFLPRFEMRHGPRSGVQRLQRSSFCPGSTVRVKLASATRRRNGSPGSRRARGGPLTGIRPRTKAGGLVATRQSYASKVPDR